MHRITYEYFWHGPTFIYENLSDDNLAKKMWIKKYLQSKNIKKNRKFNSNVKIQNLDWIFKGVFLCFLGVETPSEQLVYDDNNLK